MLLICCYYIQPHFIRSPICKQNFKSILFSNALWVPLVAMASINTMLATFLVTKNPTVATWSRGDLFWLNFRSYHSSWQERLGRSLCSWWEGGVQVLVGSWPSHNPKCFQGYLRSSQSLNSQHHLKVLWEAKENFQLWVSIKQLLQHTNKQKKIPILKSKSGRTPRKDWSNAKINPHRANKGCISVFSIWNTHSGIIWASLGWLPSVTAPSADILGSCHLNVPGSVLKLRFHLHSFKVSQTLSSRNLTTVLHTALTGFFWNHWTSISERQDPYVLLSCKTSMNGAKSCRHLEM